MYKLFFVITLFSFVRTNGQVQKTGVPIGRLMPAGNEVRVLLIPKEAKTYYLYNDATRYDIYKDAGGNGNYKKVATLTFPANFSEFKRRAGNETANEVKEILKVSSDEQAYSLLKEGKTSQFGFLFLSDRFMDGMGVFWSDKDIKQNSPSTKYRVVAVNRDGKESEFFTQSLSEVTRLPFPDFRLSTMKSEDSLVSLVWTAPSRGVNPALWVRVYRRSDRDRTFTPIPEASFIGTNTKGDSLVVRYDENVTPGRLFDYYIAPEDIVGNLGNPSDTASLISKSLNSVTGLTDFTARDSMEGVWLSWAPLANSAIYTGVEILKSRDAMEGYVVVDTISADRSSYFDKNILPNVLYYYKARPLTVAMEGWNIITPSTTSISVSNKGGIPITPKGLRVWQDTASGNINLTWDLNPDVDQFAYYVLRGTARDNMTIISPPVKDVVYIDSIQHLAAGQTYLYGIQLMNLSQRMSEMSAVRMIKPYKETFVPYPSGISSHWTGDAVQLTWENVINRQEDVVGYRLYRRTKGRTDFTIISENLMGVPGFNDKTANPGASYEYGVTAVNSSGSESLMSPLTSITIPDLALLPPSDLYLTNKADGIAISWPEEQSAATTVVYRREAQEQNFKKLGEINRGNEYLDKTAQKGKLYVYTLRMKSGATESENGPEKSIRR
ncbi:MAG: hypothetical protein J5I50_09015 [Chitinophagaceae bacterium]|nr:hypothetical protein [Chitinophagaceae bacterium]